MIKRDNFVILTSPATIEKIQKLDAEISLKHLLKEASNAIEKKSSRMMEEIRGELND
jgi:hypothetical protein